MATADTWRQRTRGLQWALGVVLVAELATVLHIERVSLAGPLLVVGSLLAAALAWLTLLTTRFAIGELEDAHRRAVEQAKAELEAARRTGPKPGARSALEALKAALAERPAPELILGSLEQATTRAPSDSEAAQPREAGPDSKSDSKPSPESSSRAGAAGETDAGS